MEIGYRVGSEANRRKVEKHVETTIGETSMSSIRRHKQIAVEADVDGIHIRTSLGEIESDTVVVANKGLSAAKRASWMAKVHPSVSTLKITWAGMCSSAC